MTATYDDLKTDIDRVARDVARDYPDIDWEDLRQELILFVLENGKSIKLRSEGGNPKKILVLVANSYSKKLRTQHLTMTPQYAYRPSDIKLILENALWPAELAGAYVPDDARDPLSRTFNTFDLDGGFSVEAIDPFHMPDAMEIASDVKAAFSRLKLDLRIALFDRYVKGIVPGNASWERKKLNKAINELTYKLNTYRGFGPDDRRMRKATSNAGARVKVTNNYEM